MNLIAIGDMPNLVDLVVINAVLMTTEGWMRLFQNTLLKKLKKLRYIIVSVLMTTLQE